MALYFMPFRRISSPSNLVIESIVIVAHDSTKILATQSADHRSAVRTRGNTDCSSTSVMPSASQLAKLSSKKKSYKPMLR